MKKGKLNIPSRTAPPATPTAMPTNFRPTTQAPAQGGKPPSVMIAVPAMEMVNAEFAQHLAMAAAIWLPMVLRLTVL